MGGGSALYLFLYNAAQACGWTLLLSRLAMHPFDTEMRDVRLARFLQTAAFLEVVHSVLGLVRSATITTLMQWAGRIHVIAVVVSQVEEVTSRLSRIVSERRSLSQLQKNPWLFIMLTAWSTSEVIRYPQYTLSSFGACPSWLTWLRYSGFIVLYPIGVLSEMALVKSSLPYISKREFRSDLFKYDDFLNVLLFAYPVLAFVLYKHMLSQRESKLRKSKRT